MKGDFTRAIQGVHTPDRLVLKQQGRVDLEADWNLYVVLRDLLARLESMDVIGPVGAPKNAAGFEVSKVTADGDFSLSKGRIYVDGIVCELANGTTYKTQPFLPTPLKLTPGTTGQNTLVYLDVWERHITAIEDPSIRETALGGPDTTTRVRTVFQIKFMNLATKATCGTLDKAVFPPSASGGALSTGTEEVTLQTDPCQMLTTSEYTGLENRLYRVEIHSVSANGAATFKWSRDNGSVAFPVEKLELLTGGKTKVQLKRLGRDDALSIHQGDYIEVSDDISELNGEPAILAKVVTEPERSDRTFEVEKNLSQFVRTPRGDFHLKVRRWDQQGPELEVVTGKKVPLENGIHVQFSGNNFRPGDYWCFFARRMPSDVEKLDKAPPLGIVHHYCPLAILTWKADGTADVESCPRKFPPLTELTSFFYLGGDGQEVTPDLTKPDELKELAEAVCVGVANGESPVEGASVQFEITKGTGGELRPSGMSAGAKVTVRTGPNGVASCKWAVKPSAGNSAQVTATLLGKDGKPLHLPIVFSASLSIADKVAFKPTECGFTPAVTTVHAALEAICKRIKELKATDIGYDSQHCADARSSSSKNVQEALDVLCGALKPIRDRLDKLEDELDNARGCCAITVKPDQNLVSVIAGLPQGSIDIHLCAGTWNIGEATIQLKDRGHIKIIGSGPGTRLITKRETFFEFKRCASVTVRDLYAQSRVVGTSGINGTLTFVDCREVTVESVVLRCSTGKSRRAACLTVRNAEPPAESVAKCSVRVRGCKLSVGNLQVGILLINTVRAHVEDNIIDVSPRPMNLVFERVSELASDFSGHPVTFLLPSATSQSIVVAGTTADEVQVLHNTIRGCAQGIHVGTSEKRKFWNSRAAPMSSGRVRIAGNTVHVALPSDVRWRRHGIFVGNCRSLVVDDNYLQHAESASVPEPRTRSEGIRIYGYLGERVFVRSNHIVGFATGIHFRARNDTAETDEHPPFWLVADNMSPWVRVDDRVQQRSNLP